MSDQKTIAQFLDMAALCAEMIGQYGATSKQCWFLAGLILKSGADYGYDSNDILTKQEASRQISFLLSQNN